MAAVLDGMKALHAEPRSRGDCCRGDQQVARVANEPDCYDESQCGGKAGDLPVALRESRISAAPRA